ncbi:thiamine-binding protein [Aquihabitans sp. G128]|uniref:thiamine-binding protein n=1 Tax=Aquihabitans sp. G128 TaxID=2849779 RepID=UPI001C250C3B|nr:thiamine-binding protein [Aquihabitans sp. G128]QXC60220.1 thiamine-binding protein [Aquihabitans sp. G128]
MPLVVEFTVEPFVEGSPGPHVRAAVDAAEASGLRVELGPFGTSVSGDDDAEVLATVDRVVRAAVGAGATRVLVQVERP